MPSERKVTEKFVYLDKRFPYEPGGKEQDFVLCRVHRCIC